MAITTVDEVKFAGGLTNEFSDEEIETEIDLVEAELYDKYYLPRRAQFSVDVLYTNFYISTDTVHEIIRVQGSVETDVDPSGYTGIASGSYTFTTPNKYISLTTDTITEYENTIVRVQYIPKSLNGLASNLVALNLSDTTTIVDGEETISPLTIRLKAKINRYKMLLKPKIMLKSSQNVDYDEYEYISLSQSDLR